MDKLTNCKSGKDKFAKENKFIVHLENLKHQIRKATEENKEKMHFWLSTKSESLELKEAIERLKEKFEQEKQKFETSKNREGGK